MASVTVKHLLAPLWSVGMDAETEAACCGEATLWENTKVHQFVAKLDTAFDSFLNKPLAELFSEVHPTLEASPVCYNMRGGEKKFQI